MIGLVILSFVILFILIAPTMGLGNNFKSDDNGTQSRSVSRSASKGIKLKRTGKIRGSRASFTD